MHESSGKGRLATEKLDSLDPRPIEETNRFIHFTVVEGRVSRKESIEAYVIMCMAQHLNRLKG